MGVVNNKNTLAAPTMAPTAPVLSEFTEDVAAAATIPA